MAAIGNLAVLDIQANAFLLHMVRNIAGALLEVGDGRRPEHWIEECLAARDRPGHWQDRPGQGTVPRDVHYPGYDFPAGRLPPLLSAVGDLEALQAVPARGDPGGAQP